jgi:hypothetical protein
MESNEGLGGRSNFNTTRNIDTDMFGDRINFDGGTVRETSVSPYATPPFM